VTSAGRVTRAFVIVNPAAGNRRTRQRWLALREELARSGLTIEVGQTTGPGAATTLARQAVLDGWPLVIAVGGDGTVNEVINGLVDPSGRPLAALGVIATGRGRDVCRNLGIATDPEAAVRGLANAPEVSVDLNRAEWPDGGQRYFVNAGGIGFDAEVAARSRASWGPGTVPYLIAVMTTLGRYAPRAATVEVDGAVVSRDPVAAVVVANGEYYGGGMRIAPGASPRGADPLAAAALLGPAPGESEGPGLCGRDGNRHRPRAPGDAPGRRAGLAGAGAGERVSRCLAGALRPGRRGALMRDTLRSRDPATKPEVTAKR
jgi:diacylglycerol kinase (ATP)